MCAYFCYIYYQLYVDGMDRATVERKEKKKKSILLQ